MAIPIIGEDNHAMKSQAVITITEIGYGAKVAVHGSGASLEIAQQILNAAMKHKRSREVNNGRGKIE